MSTDRYAEHIEASVETFNKRGDRLVQFRCGRCGRPAGWVHDTPSGPVVVTGRLMFDDARRTDDVYPSLSLLEDGPDDAPWLEPIVATCFKKHPGEAVVIERSAIRAALAGQRRVVVGSITLISLQR